MTAAVRVRLFTPGALVRLVFAGLLGVLTEAAGIGLVGTATWMIVRAADQPPLAALSVAIAAVRGFALIKGGLRYAERLAGHDAVLRVLADLRARAFGALAVSAAPDGAAPAARVESGDVLSRVVSDVDGVQDAVLRSALPAGVAAVVGLAAVSGVAVVDPRAGLVLLAGLLVAGVVLPLAGHRLAVSRADGIAAARGDLTTATVDVVHGVAELAAYGALPAALADADARGRRLAALEARSSTVAAVVGGVAALFPAAVAVWIGVIADEGSAAVLALVALTVGEVVVPLAAAAVRHAELRGGLRRVRALIATAAPESPAPAPHVAEPHAAGPHAAGPHAAGPHAAVPRAGVAAKPLTEPLIAVPRAGVAAEPHAGPLAEPPAAALLAGVGAEPHAGQLTGQLTGPLTGAVDLVLRGVTVRYGDGLPPALVDVDLVLPAGSRVAVVGASGSGKSTLLAAIAGRVPLASGAVEGMPAGVAAWRVAGGVFADAHVFHTTVRDNLLLGREISGGDATLRRALADAGLAEYGDRLDEIVGEDGGKLSGGQRQRLLLARALVAAPPVLLLDEPTEGLDAAAADAVLDTALRAAGERTVVVVTHRAAELGRFDRVVRVAEGRTNSG
ncbi:ATP-binding cassette domain-containing protein [Dactylosporangium sp. NPDC005555]|uniref:amino acid ABC transporter ATP-binding/permease protein n=1 Tax=Dactylosporangium sp. NPDC005555 TaxID=3154889 RepID=UPI0033A7D2DA